MARYHWWGFIVNEAGEPIENAEITVSLAGTDDLASVYYDEFGNANSTNNPALSAGPQLSTLSNGYYEFWVGDVTEIHGYSNDTKFKLRWIRLGVAEGIIDYINIFPLGPQTYPLTLSGCADMDQSTVFDKLISDYLGCKWDNHVDATVINSAGQFESQHGLEFVKVDQLDEVQNKIINNYHGFHWHEHRLSTVQNYHPSAGRPHNMEEVNPYDGTSGLRNKLVSNLDLFNLHSRITNLNVHSDDGDANLQVQINDLSSEQDTSKSGWYHIYGTMWIQGLYDIWYVDIAHDLDIWYPLVQVYETSGGKMIQSTEIEFQNKNIIRVSIQNAVPANDPILDLHVRIANGGVQRYSPLP